MKNYRAVILLTFIFFSGSLFAQSSWQKISTVEQVCSAYPEQIKSIFQNLNLNHAGLTEVKKAYESNNLSLACKNLLNYYDKSNLVQEDLTPASQKSITAVDSVLRDIYTFQNISGQVPRLANGQLKWAYAGPEDDIEWAWALNRHYPVNTLLNAYFETGNPKYAQYIDNFVQDWIISSWPYPGVKSSTAMWRGLEVSFRVKVWSRVFFGLMKTKLISPATQLLILSSLPDHAHYARNFHAQGNWLTMEISGLATVASSWPEFKESKAWMDYSIEAMVASMKDQVYPDGVQTELTSSYHQVALSNFRLFADICRKNKVALPEYYTKTLEKMWNYLALTMRPDGFGLLNNDADLINNRSDILKIALTYNRPDWTYIASNGKSGTRPLTGPSFIFPYAGHLISRGGYDADAQWSFFDIGPWGSGHQHNDKLNLTVAAFGREFLVDGGRFAYRGEVADKFRKYATGSQSHNVIMVDGGGQAPGPKLTDASLPESRYKITDDFDYATGTFDKYINLEGEFSHTRASFYVRSKFWVIADQIKTDRPRKIEALWHWHPGCLVREEKKGIVSAKNNHGNLRIIPVGSPVWKVSLVKGQEKPAVQGWYSKEYNTYEPNTASIYSAQLNSDNTFVWILWPFEAGNPVIKSEILSQDENSVKVRISDSAKRYWDIQIPFVNCADARMNFVSEPTK